jgi:type IV fimbrial biogenesis protein FimT
MRTEAQHRPVRFWRQRERGFSAIELMVALSVAAILATLAIPNLRTFIQNNRLSSASNDLLRSFQLARSSAIKYGTNVVICAADTTATALKCSGGPFTQGWIVFRDSSSAWDYTSGDVVLERHEPLDPSLTARFDGNAIESYAASGFANTLSTPKTPTQAILLCDSRQTQQRAVLITRTGRVRVGASSGDLNAASATTGNCPS